MSKTTNNKKEKLKSLKKAEKKMKNKKARCLSVYLSLSTTCQIQTDLGPVFATFLVRSF